MGGQPGGVAASFGTPLGEEQVASVFGCCSCRCERGKEPIRGETTWATAQ